MKAYHNSVVLRNDGEDPSTLKLDLNAGITEQVTVRINSSQALAVIFDVDDIATGNPLTTDNNGNYAFKAADNIYDIIVAEGTANEVKLEKVEIAEIPTAPILINDLSQAYEFPTVAAYKAFVTAFPVGKVIHLLDRGAEFTVIAGTGTANTFNIIASDQVSQSIDLDVDDEIKASAWGAIESGDTFAALDNLNTYCAANGKTMYLDDDKVFITASRIPVGSNTRIAGFGTLKVADGANIYPLGNLESVVTQIENVSIQDITIDGNRANQTAATQHNNGIYINYCDNLTINNVKVQSCGTPETEASGSNNAVGISLHECINFEITNCHVKDCMHYNYQVWESLDGIVSNNISEDPGSHCYGGAANLRVIYDGNNGSIIWERSAFTYDPLINAGQGMWFRQYDSCVISSNTMYRKTDGVETKPLGVGLQIGNEPSLQPLPQSPRLQNLLIPDQPVKTTTITSNTVTGDFEFGIYGFSGKIEEFNTGGNTVSGCWGPGLIVTSGRLISSGDTIINCGGSGQVPDAAIWAAGRDHHISGSTVIDANSRGIHAQGIRSVIDNPKIEGYGKTIKDYGIYINDFSNDVAINNPQVFTDIPATESFNAVYIGDDAERVSMTGGNLNSQPTAADAIRPNNRSDHNINGVIGQATASGSRYKLPKRDGEFYLWWDTSSNYRTKLGAPSTDTDGVVIGTQT